MDTIAAKTQEELLKKYRDDPLTRCRYHGPEYGVAYYPFHGDERIYLCREGDDHAVAVVYNIEDARVWVRAHQRDTEGVKGCTAYQVNAICYNDGYYGISTPAIRGS